MSEEEVKNKIITDEEEVTAAKKVEDDAKKVKDAADAKLEKDAADAKLAKDAADASKAEEDARMENVQIGQAPTARRRRVSRMSMTF